MPRFLEVSDTSLARSAIGASSAGGRIFAVDYGGTWDGVGNDRDAVVAAFAEASVGDTVVLPSKVYNGGAVVAVPDDVTLDGCNTTVWTGAGVTIGNRTRLRGVHLKGDKTGLKAEGETTTEGVSVRTGTKSWSVDRCVLSNWSIGINIGLNANDYGVITNNRFYDNSNYAIFVVRASNLTITNNLSEQQLGEKYETSYAAGEPGAHFTFFNIQQSTISNNTLINGISGIVQLAWRSLTGSRVSSHNTISGNVVLNPSEEGISLDCNGGSSTNISVLDWGTIDAVEWVASGSVLRLTMDSAFSAYNPNSPSEGQPAWKPYQVVITTGGAAGFTAQIDSGVAGKIYCNNVREEVSNLIRPGDEFAVGTPALANTITGNTVYGAGNMGINLWGFGVGNVITGNTVYGLADPAGANPNTDTRHGIEVWGLDGAETSDRSVSDRDNRLPSVANIVQGNVLMDCDSQNSVRVYNEAAGYTPVSNKFFDNTYINATHIGPSFNPIDAKMMVSAPPAYQSGRYYFCNSVTSSTASTFHINGRLRVAPWQVLAPVNITRLGAEVTVASTDAGSVFRIGVWLDNGYGAPGDLLLDAGTIPVDGATGKAEVTVDLWLTPGTYHVGGAVQGVVSSVPTITSGGAESIDPSGFSAGSLAGIGTAVSWFQNGVTGAFGSSFTAVGTSGNTAPRIIFKVA